MADIWQLNIVRGGLGETDPWIHEGGAEEMAVGILRQTGIWSEEKVARYHADKAAKCEQLGKAVGSYDGIYACGLARFDKMGVPVVPLWRAMMQATETDGTLYSVAVIRALGGKVGAD